MYIKEVRARVILDSRKEKTIEVSVNNYASSAPSGKSRGKHEKKPYLKNIEGDVSFLNNFDRKLFSEIHEFSDLEKVEDVLKEKIGANSLFALESSILKALAFSKNLPIWKIANPELEAKGARFPRLLSNTIGGGAHSQSKVKPDFQEFLVSCDKNPRLGELMNRKCHDEAGKILNNLRLNNTRENDEHAWASDLDNERVLEIMKEIQEDVYEDTSTHVDIGLDIAGSQFYKPARKKYYYKNKKKILGRQEQIDYIVSLARKYNLFYIEDPLEEEDFSGYSEINKQLNELVIIAGDDLTVTNLERVRKAIDMKAVSGVIVKPNQTGSLIEARKIVDLCRKHEIYTILSHRSGETYDSIIADLAFGWQCDFIKIPVVGEERLVKVNRLKEIENELRG